jgi:hypothetical protein
MKRKPFDIAVDGQPVFAALVKPLKNGGVSVSVLIEDNDGEKDDRYSHVEFNGELAIVLASRLEALVGEWA